MFYVNTSFIAGKEVILLEKTHKTFSVSVFDVGNNPTNLLSRKGLSYKCVTKNS